MASAIPEIRLRALKLKMGHVTLTTHLLGVVCQPLALTAIVSDQYSM